MKKGRLCQANGTIRCRISGDCDEVIFTPDHDHFIKHGKRHFVAFVPKGKHCRELGFVIKLRNGSIGLALDEFGCLDLAVKAALCHTKVTVMVSPPKPKCGPKLKALVVPAEPTK